MTTATAALKAAEVPYEERKRAAAEKKKQERALKAMRDRIADLEARIADREKAVKDLEQQIAAPEFYAAPDTTRSVLERHQQAMWEVGELLGQWEMMQSELSSMEELLKS